VKLANVADRTSEIRDQAKRVVDNAASAIRPHQEDHTFRNLVTFAAGVGLGVGAGMLLAPARGAELRSSISDRVRIDRDDQKADMGRPLQ
jgi:gas vesicle protein